MIVLLGEKRNLSREGCLHAVQQWPPDLRVDADRQRLKGIHCMIATSVAARI